MQEARANLVQPIFEYALGLREQVEADAPLDLDAEQAALEIMLGKIMLGAPEFIPDEAAAVEGQPIYVGSAYAITCWLDELFTQYSPWADAWARQPLEFTLFGSNARDWKFWEQAEMALGCPEDLEVFHLCALLGFRGDLAEDPGRLHAWFVATEEHLAEYQKTVWQPPPGLVPTTDVPPLHGRTNMRRLVIASGLMFLGTIPLLAYFASR